MIQYKRAFLLFAAGLLVSAGKVSADTAPASTTPAPVATVAAAPAKHESPTYTAMKAANDLAASGKNEGKLSG